MPLSCDRRVVQCPQLAAVMIGFGAATCCVSIVMLTVGERVISVLLVELALWQSRVRVRETYPPARLLRRVAGPVLSCREMCWGGVTRTVTRTPSDPWRHRIGRISRRATAPPTLRASCHLTGWLRR